MAAYALYVLRRFGQFVLVVFVGINIAFFVTHATPIDPIMAAIAAATRFSQSDPQAVQMTREALRELYGLQGSLWQQYVAFWMRVAVADFGPSLSAFPTPVSTLIWRAMPWTFGLLSIATLISWGLGNFLGGLAGYYRRNVWLKVFGVVASGLRPIPNYVMAFVVLVLFGYVWPILPITGSAQINLPRGWTLAYLQSVFEHGLLPVLSLVLVGRGLVHRDARARLQHRYGGLCHLRRTRRGRSAAHPDELTSKTNLNQARHRQEERPGLLPTSLTTLTCPRT